MNTFLSTENKAMIWQLLLDAGAFANIPDHYFKRVQELYENTIIEIAQISIPDLKEKNKVVLTEMVKKLPYLKQQILSRPLEEVNVQVSKQYKEKQEEFIELVNHDKPSEINFNDNQEDEPLETSTMNNMLNNMMDSREKELNQIRATNPLPIDQSNQNTESSLIKRDNVDCTDYIWSAVTNTSRSSNFIKPEKRVSFDNNFMNKLKISDDNQTNQTNQDKLNEILKNQELILKKLEALNIPIT